MVAREINIIFVNVSFLSNTGMLLFPSLFSLFGSTSMVTAVIGDVLFLALDPDPSPYTVNMLIS